MAEQRPVFTDVGAYGRPTPGGSQVTSAAPVYDALGDVADSAMRLAAVFKQQDQDKAVLDAKIGMAEGFQALRQKVSEETDFTKAQEMFEKGAAEIKAKVEPFEIDGAAQSKIGASYAASYQDSQADVYRQIVAKRSSAYLASADTLAAKLRDTAPLDGQLDRQLTATKAQIKEQAQKMFSTGTLDKDNAGRWERRNLSETDDALATWDVRNMPQQALTMLKSNKDGEWQEYKDLDVKRREALIAQAEGYTRQNAANLNELEKQAVSNIWQGLGDGEQQLREAQRRGANGVQWQDMQGKVSAAKTLKADYDKIKFMPYNEMSAAVAEVAKRAAKPGNEYQSNLLPDFAREVDTLQKQMVKEPAKTMDALYPMPSPKMPDGKEWPIAARMSQRLAGMQASGIAGIVDEKQVMAMDRLLTMEEVSSLTGGLMNTPQPQKPLAMQQLQQSMGDYARAGVDQLRREGTLPGQYVLMADKNITPTGIQALSVTAGNKENDLAKNLADPEKDRKLISAEIRQSFRDGIGKTFASPDDYRDFLEASVLVGLSYGQQDAGSAPGKAMKDLWGSIKTIDTVRLPAGTTAQQEQNVKNHLALATVNVERFKPFIGNTPLGEYRSRIQQEGKWYTYQGAGGEDEGVRLVWQGATQMDVNGNPITMTFAELQSEQAPSLDEITAKRLQDPRTRARIATGYLPPTPGAR